jgi:ribosomal protein L40E
MPSTPSLQCLFCKHLNPADAIFCNECGTQLNLQPCKRCGAIDDRAAEKCYKCGASFTLPAQPGAESLLAPAIPGKEPAPSTLSDTGPAATLPTKPTHDLAEAPSGLQWAAQTASPETDANAARSRRRWLVAIAGLLLVLAIDMVFVYFYYGEPEQLAQTEIEKPGIGKTEPEKTEPEKTEIVKQAVPEVPVEPKPDGLAPPEPAMPVDAALKPEDTAPIPATRPQASQKVPSRAPPKAVAAVAVRPLPAATPPVKRRQEPPVSKECPQALATLGLCNAPTND